MIIGECKDQGAIKIEDFQKDIDNLRRVVDAFPYNRFDSFVLFAKLSPFTPEEIQEAKTLNDKYHHRAILLTARELEPFFIYERTEVESKIQRLATSPEDLARATVEMYFNEQPNGSGGA